MDEILKCLKAAEELKKTVLDQQNLLKKLLVVFKNPKSNYRCCPMCETIFENEYDTFEEHVISHFEDVDSQCSCSTVLRRSLWCMLNR